ncbi:uncharacterized protein BCR38DRAFT_484095 [Pseudomassariella vexata]|uniref:C2H2 type master regulator of conidiophore development brlA n=1 Tax=Pseudomassariella vexata TaxID=1141098 RepID=A0A1Y2E4M0_9PEZI|nr:uncharacterized protein BCR38DRAFT_484095 [Pseudomassariella vexata]ORY66472.1 hypothetical protein BCR38DRAFT_484095 [Pseudomassariella vexata]
MQARDATGRQVSLLNDESFSQPLTFRTTSHYPSARDGSPYPTTPELLRSDSYDSNTSYDPASPITPTVYDYANRGPYEDYLSDQQATIKRPAYVGSRSNSYEDESSNGSSAPERTGKRYPCRYRDSHGCEKTFTTSGHASRHSKIHTAEKAVQCSYPACHKKFTRADNMKQHLETHFKDKSRSSASSKASSKHSHSTSVKRGSVSSRSTTSHSSQMSQDVQMWDVEQYPHDATQLPSPGGAWDMRGLNMPLMSRPVAGRTSSSGLDALAAIACQEGES